MWCFVAQSVDSEIVAIQYSYNALQLEFNTVKIILILSMILIKTDHNKSRKFILLKKHFVCVFFSLGGYRRI